MASGSTEHGPLSLVAGMKRDLECVVCLDEKELRSLSCTHRLCVECGDEIIKKSEERAGSGKAEAKCPVCSELISKPMLEYDVYEPSRIFCDPLKRLSEILKRDALNTCQNEDCEKKNQVVKFCKQCQKYLCFVCDRDGPCEGDDDAHNSIDTDKLAEDCRESLEQWKQIKTLKRDHMLEKKKQLCKELKILASMLVDMSDACLVEAVQEGNHVSKLSSSAERLAAVEKTIAVIESELQFVVSNTAQICDVELIRLVEQLDLRETREQRKLGAMTEIIADHEVKDLSLGPDGTLLIGMNNKFCQVEISGEARDISRTIDVPGCKVYAVKMIKTETINLIATCDVSLESRLEALQKHRICIYSLPDYVLRQSWDIPPSTDMTVCGNKIFIAGGDESDIKVFDPLTGEELAPIIRNGYCGGITSILPNGLLVHDLKNHVVQKYKVNKYNGRWTIAWSTNVTRPWHSCVDSHGSIWVRSNVNDCITIFDKHGVKVQEIKDIRISQHGQVWGLGVVQDVLWLATDKGLICFEIEYEKPAEPEDTGSGVA